MDNKKLVQKTLGSPLKNSEKENEKKISNKKHDWTTAKYLNILHHYRTQKHFFLILLQKYYHLPILSTLDSSGHFHQKW